MTPEHLTDHTARLTGGDHAPPLPPSDPPVGSVSMSPIPAGVELQAQALIHEAGSAALAKIAVDGAAEREIIPDFREDQFGRRFGFTSRSALLAASKPLTAADGVAWWATAIAGNGWIVWNQQDMSATKTFSTLQEARNSVNPAVALAP